MLRMLSRSVVSDSLWPHGLYPARLLCPWNSPGKNIGVGSFQHRDWTRSPTLLVGSLPSEPPGKPMNTGVGSLSLLQGIFPTQEWNQGLLHELTSWTPRDSLREVQELQVSSLFTTSGIFLHSPLTLWPCFCCPTTQILILLLTSLLQHLVLNPLVSTHKVETGDAPDWVLGLQQTCLCSWYPQTGTVPPSYFLNMLSCSAMSSSLQSHIL